LSLFSRNRKRLNDKYPEIAAAFHQQETDSFIADGGIVTFKDGITSFAKLQERMQVGREQAMRTRTSRLADGPGALWDSA
jgi:ATP-dependent DNA ligase